MRETSGDDEKLRRYLLGQQPHAEGAEADRLELRLLADGDLFELAEAVEGELLDEWARGELAGPEIESLARRLAASPAGRLRLAQAERLATATPHTPKAVPTPVLAFRRRGFAGRPARAALLALAAGLAGAAVTLWQLDRPHPPHLQHAVARVVATAPAPARPLPLPIPAPVRPTPPTVPPQEAQLERPHPQLPSAVLPPAVLALSVMTTRGAEALPELRLPPGVHKVELRLLLEAGESYSSYEVTVNHEEGGEVSRQVLTAPPEGEPLTLRLPARFLPAGSYLVTLKGIPGEGAPEEVGFPRFRVQR
jgi:hypothetical protein